ncbi:MAG: ATP-binding protein [Candidatus Nanohaloarchaea archaeon]|nr:ATP-binding protein [Candidatus Nanohaloarchaea archaeon]
MKDFGVLLDQNPWWKGEEELNRDYDIQRWREKEYRWKPDIVDEIPLEPFAFNIVVGPRQVGKTTAVKLLIRDLIQDNIEKSVFYFNCEEISDFKELLEVVETYLDIRDRAGIESSYIFLDEVASVEKWQKAVKSLIDKGTLRNDVLTVTGSMSLKIKREAELFPGRRGNGEDCLMLPLSFRQFVELHEPGLAEEIPRLGSLEEDEIAEKASEAVLFKDKLKELLLSYFGTGGLPLSVASMGDDIDVKTAKKSYLDYMKTDILELGKSDDVAREVMSTILTKMPSHVSWSKIARDISVKSHKTAASYARLFKEMYAILILPHIDISSKRLKYGKNKKFHVVDPLFLKIFEEWGLIQLDNRREILAESCIASHLARFTSEGLDLGERIGYWKNKKEIDVIVKAERTRGFEVKWSDNVKDVKMYEKYGEHMDSMVFLLEDNFKTDPLIVPIPVFLAMI